MVGAHRGPRLSVRRVAHGPRPVLVQVDGTAGVPDRAADQRRSASMTHDLPWLDHGDQVFGGRTYAQHGDDLIMLAMFHQLKIYKPTWLDVGAHHPYHLSNTALMYERGGRGINVEPNPDLMGDFARFRPEDVNVNAGVGATSGTMRFYRTNAPGLSSFDHSLAVKHGIASDINVPVVTVGELVAKTGNMFPDLLTVDAEGLDMEILTSIDWSGSTPKVVCAEAFTADRGISNDLRQLLVGNGYFLHSWAVNNMIFAHCDLRERLVG